MIYPAPVPGLVIRYGFLWSEDAKRGSAEGRKDRPRAIVVALPPAVKAALGLDTEISWVRLDELNVFVWPGHDLRPIPGTDRIVYGTLPKAIFEDIRKGVLALQQARRTRRVDRD